MCSSQQFSVGHCVFSGVTIFVYSNVLGVMLSTNAMFKSELNKQSLSRGKIKISLFPEDWFGIRFLAKRTEHTLWWIEPQPFVFSSQLWWKSHFGNFDFSSPNWSFSSSFALDISAVSSSCCCRKKAERLLCFHVTLHSCTSREGLSIKHVDLNNLLPYSVYSNKCPETLQNWAF